MLVIEGLLKVWQKQKHKVLLFSQSRQMLSVIESFLLSRHYTYMRLDGSTSIGSRHGLIHKFNNVIITHLPYTSSPMSTHLELVSRHLELMSRMVVSSTSRVDTWR